MFAALCGMAGSLMALTSLKKETHFRYPATKLEAFPSSFHFFLPVKLQARAFRMERSYT